MNLVTKLKIIALEFAACLLSVYMVLCGTVIGFEVIGLRDWQMFLFGILVCVPLGLTPFVDLYQYARRSF